MKITPLDIRKQKFDMKLRGLDPEAVESFLFIVAEELETILREKEELREMAGRLEAELRSFTGREKILKDTLYTAQRTADEQRRNAEKEAQTIIKQAEMMSQQLIHQARDKIAAMQKDISDLKLDRYNLKSEIRAVIDRYGKILDVVEDEEKEREKLEFLVNETSPLG